MRSQFNISHLKKRTSRPFLWHSVHIKADLHGRTGGVIHLPLNRISEWQDQCQSTFNSIISKSKHVCQIIYFHLSNSQVWFVSSLVFHATFPMMGKIFLNKLN